MSGGGDSSLSLLVPSILVVPQKKPPGPKPFPGTVEPEDLRPETNPPKPFLRPWSNQEKQEQGMDHPPMRCKVDPTQLEAYLERHDVAKTLSIIFKEREDCADIVEQVLRSLKDPFKGNASDIVWTHVPRVHQNPDRDARLGGKNLKSRHKILAGGQPWSIASFGEEKGGVKKNIVYDGEGNAIAQVDFGHGQQIGIHVHALVLNNLEHAAGSSEHHCFELHDVPWPWLCIPDVRQCPSARAEYLGLPLATPPHTLDMDDGTMDGWVPVTVPYEDYMGERMYSQESL